MSLLMEKNNIATSRQIRKENLGISSLEVHNFPSNYCFSIARSLDTYESTSNPIRRKIIQNYSLTKLIYGSCEVFIPNQVNYYPNWYIKYVNVLEELSKLPQNWDSYGAEPPNSIALHWGRIALSILKDMNFSPTSVTASVENGIGISFLNEEKYGDIECFNTGEILAVISNGQGNPDVWTVVNSEEEIKLTLERICVFIRR